MAGHLPGGLRCRGRLRAHKFARLARRLRGPRADRRDEPDEWRQLRQGHVPALRGAAARGAASHSLPGPATNARQRRPRRHRGERDNPLCGARVLPAARGGGDGGGAAPHAGRRGDRDLTRHASAQSSYPTTSQLNFLLKRCTAPHWRCRAVTDTSEYLQPNAHNRTHDRYAHLRTHMPCGAPRPLGCNPTPACSMSRVTGA
mmetsp:Transcript_24600/g.61823  ORF Transcript_24600/g.61823 Transcript_24600/m.61823 type:complete len:202 (-) Transcript_24600:69-674(-)